MIVPEGEEVLNVKEIIYHYKGILGIDIDGQLRGRTLNLVTTDLLKVNCSGCLGVLRDKANNGEPI